MTTLLPFAAAQLIALPAAPANDATPPYDPEKIRSENGGKLATERQFYNQHAIATGVQLIFAGSQPVLIHRQARDKAGNILGEAFLISGTNVSEPELVIATNDKLKITNAGGEIKIEGRPGLQLLEVDLTDKTKSTPIPTFLKAEEVTSREKKAADTVLYLHTVKGTEYATGAGAIGAMALSETGSLNVTIDAKPPAPGQPPRPTPVKLADDTADYSVTIRNLPRTLADKKTPNRLALKNVAFNLSDVLPNIADSSGSLDLRMTHAQNVDVTLAYDNQQPVKIKLVEKSHLAEGFGPELFQSFITDANTEILSANMNRALDTAQTAAFINRQLPPQPKTASKKGL